MNIVTSVCIDTDKEGENIKYPMLGNKVDRRIVYWRCVATFCLTSIKYNPDDKHLVYTNDKEPIIIDNCNIKNKLTGLGVEIIELEFGDFDPKAYSKRFRNAFYKHEVINAIAALQEPSILLDSDCIWTKRDDFLFDLLKNGEYVLLQDTYQRSSTPNSKSPHNLSMKDMGDLYKTIPLLRNQTNYPVWYGGEVIGGTPHHLKLIAKNLYEVLAYAKKQKDSGNELLFANGNSIFDNDEFVSSYVYNSLPNIKIYDSYGKFTKRMWTLKHINNIKEGDINITIWHLTAEKDTGLKRLFDEINKESSPFWKEEKSFSNKFLWEIVNIHSFTIKKWGYTYLSIKCKNLLKRIFRR